MLVQQLEVVVLNFLYSLQNSKISDTDSFLLWISIPSAFASIYEFALLSASSIPLSKMRLSILAIILKSSVDAESLPIDILLLKFSMNLVFDLHQFRGGISFNPVLSSITTAETPLFPNFLQ